MKAFLYSTTLTLTVACLGAVSTSTGALAADGCPSYFRPDYSGRWCVPSVVRIPRRFVSDDYAPPPPPRYPPPPPPRFGAPPPYHYGAPPPPPSRYQDDDDDN